MGYIIDKAKIVPVVPAISTGAYTAGDVVGGLLTFADVVGSSGNGMLNWIRLVDDDSEGAELTLYLFDAAPTDTVDKDPFAPTVADLKKLIYKHVFAAADYVTVNGNDYILVEDINLVFNTLSNALYGYLVCTATPTYTAVTDLHVTLGVATA